MKKLFILAALVAFGLSAQAQQGLFSCGFKAGLGLANQNVTYDYVSSAVNTNGTSLNPNDKSVLAVNGGAYAEVGIPKTPIGIYAGVAVRTKGTKSEFTDPTIGTITKTINGTYFTADLVGKYYLANLPFFKPYLGAGVRTDFKLSEAIDYADGSAKPTSADDVLRNKTLSGLLVGGVQVWKIGAEIEWNPDITYAKTGTATPNVSVKSRNSVVSVNLSFRLFSLL